jgi:5-methylcytosine-specific restriction protein A
VFGGGSRCEAHPADNTFADRRRGSRQSRGYGAEWDKLRLVILKRDAYTCQHHFRLGVVHPGRIVDHIRNKAEGGTDDPGNLETICDEWNREKTQQEALRARRARGGGGWVETSGLKT